jgi:Protein of unknwon function (DUF3008)
MPAKSKKQQMAAGAALAAKRGERKKSSLKGASKGMYGSMSKAELRRMAKTKRKGKPTRKTKKRWGQEWAGFRTPVLVCLSAMLFVRTLVCAEKRSKPQSTKTWLNLYGAITSAITWIANLRRFRRRPQKTKILRIESTECRFHGRSNPNDPFLHSGPKQRDTKIAPHWHPRPAHRCGTSGVGQAVWLYFFDRRQRRIADAITI